MGKIRITADSTCDLSESLLRQYEISILPLNIVLDMKSYSDGEEISPDEIYAWAEKMRKTPKTAAVSFDRALEAASAFQKNGEEMIFFGISEAMSTTCNVMRMVKEELNYTDMYVIDSQNLSTGIGLQVLRAAELALPKGFALKVVRFPGGKDPDELLRNSGPEAIQEAVEKARDFFEFALSYLNGENGTEPAGKAATAEQMLRFIAELESDAAKAAYVGWLAEQMKLNQFLKIRQAAAIR